MIGENQPENNEPSVVPTDENVVVAIMSVVVVGTSVVVGIVDVVLDVVVAVVVVAASVGNGNFPLPQYIDRSKS